MPTTDGVTVAPGPPKRWPSTGVGVPLPVITQRSAAVRLASPLEVVSTVAPPRGARADCTNASNVIGAVVTFSNESR